MQFACVASSEVRDTRPLQLVPGKMDFQGFPRRLEQHPPIQDELPCSEGEWQRSRRSEEIERALDQQPAERELTPPLPRVLYAPGPGE